MSLVIASQRNTYRRQRGSFLLEALIAVLIVALGILGLIGLEAKSIQNVDDNQFRAEAVFMANTLISQMWTTDQKLLQANFDSGMGGPNYTEFKAFVQARLPGAAVRAPNVTITPPPPAPAAAKTDAIITIFWKPPGEAPSAACSVAIPPVQCYHQYTATATIGLN